MPKLVVWGVSGQARVLAEFAKSNSFEIAAFIDNDPDKGSVLDGISIYHGEDGLDRFLAAQATGSEIFGIAAIGGWRGEDRLMIHRIFSARGIRIANLVHPTAYVAHDAIVGSGAQILARSVVGAAARLGDSVIVNTAASVDHECDLGNGVHVAPGATLAGCVTVGDRSLVGPGAVVIPRIRVGSDTIIGAGAVVTRDLPDGVVAYGAPARVVRDR